MKITYREYIYEMCNNTDMANEEKATLLAKELATEAIEYHDISMAQEAKLQEIMSYADYVKWSKETAKRIFKNEISGMADGDFKDMILEHFDEITA